MTGDTAATTIAITDLDARHQSDLPAVIAPRLLHRIPKPKFSLMACGLFKCDGVSRPILWAECVHTKGLRRRGLL
jgi:hypothetical protein